MHLVIVDTAQIQPYIFGSNRLRENVGASHLVAQSSGAWTLEAVRKVAPQSNVNTDGRTLDPTKHLEDPTAKLGAEVLYAGGGNVVVLFQSGFDAKAFTRELSRKVLLDAPNLQLAIAQRTFDWSQSLAAEVKADFEQLAKEKRALVLSAPLLGLSVTAMCQSTGMPAVNKAKGIGGEPDRYASAETMAKLRVVEKSGPNPSEADQRLRELLPPPADYDYPSQLDHLGVTKGEHSFIAVVHADGDAMGQRIADIGRPFLTNGKHREYINAIRSFSCKVEEAAQKALEKVLGQLVTRLKRDGGDRIVHKNAALQILTEVNLKSADGERWYLPFRPIVFGGDDVTFVCDGRLGLSLATEYMKAFEEETDNRPECGGKITACAGIAIVKAHYPFSRAYGLAVELCKSAKRYRHEMSIEGSCLDWHFALSGLSGSIDEIRRREFTCKSGRLTLRPMALGANPNERHKSWDVVRKGIDEFQGKRWAERRNKVKALRDALRNGGDSVEHFLVKFNEGEPLAPVEPSMTDWPTRGWQGSQCGYFDAIELADWFVPLG